MAAKRASGGLDHLTTVPENFDAESVDDGNGCGDEAEYPDGGDGRRGESGSNAE